MKVYCIASNQYADLVPGFETLVDLYWPDADLTTLHYDRFPEAGLDCHHERVYLGPQPAHWSDALVDFFQSVPEPYFALMLEDYWLHAPVDPAAIDLAETLIRVRDADKVDLGVAVERQKHQRYRPGSDLIVQAQDADYRASLHAHVWTRRYLISILERGWSPWEFEICGSNKARHDGALIYGAISDPRPLRYANVFRSGGVLNQIETPLLCAQGRALLQSVLEKRQCLTQSI